MEGVIEKAPSLSAVTVPIITFPFKRVIIDSASALPAIVGDESFVIGEEVPKEEGALGAVVSIVIAIDADIEETFSAESVEVAVIE